MKITIDKHTNGIHDSLVMNAENIKDENDPNILFLLVQMIKKYNAKQVENA